MQHFIGYPTNSSYLCGADAVGRRNTRTDTDPSLTTCRACKASTHFPTADTETTHQP